ncbi:circadian clock protein KaiA [Leptodesmis sp.]|uniref:circadian clock protein KaiA n=1 Tax=Leptodesmis sp. TaxID=3100501 RepID=UPI0040535402
MHPRLSICALLFSDTLAQAISDALSHPPQADSTTEVQYQITILRSNEEFCRFIEQEKQHLDCLILQGDNNLPYLVNWLYRHVTLLPAVIIPSENSIDQSIILADGASPATPPDQAPAEAEESFFTYHIAEVSMPVTESNNISHYVDQAIARFINLSPACHVTRATPTAEVSSESERTSLQQQQHRLSEKLKERLGYLGVYFKRNPQNFLRHLPADEKQELLEKLREDYRSIVLCYFLEDGTLNQKIDNFVNMAFFADIPTAQIVEIHMNLMDEFSKQLKLEGRSEEILLDYRLTLIDVIAHLCEMYRRSIPGNLKDENL